MSEINIRTMDELSNLDMENIPINEYWNLGDFPEFKIHSIHAYPAKFPAFIATKAMQYAADHEVKISKISDVFCGCGTVALEAKLSGIDFWGCDINPVATLIASVKATVYNCNKLDTYYNFICEEYRNINILDNVYDNANERLRYWYDKERYIDLLKLKLSIMSIRNSKYKKAFECLFSSILKATSKWLTKSIKPQIDPNKHPADVKSSFYIQYQQFRKSVLTDSNMTSKIDIETCSFLAKRKLPMVDVVITSPPYVTSYEYADLHQLSSLWLDYTNDYTELRKGTIGSSYNNKVGFLETLDLNITGKRIVDQLHEDKKINLSKVKSVGRYFKDMQTATSKCYSMLNKNGMAFFVVGDTEYKGVKIYNSKHLIESLLNCGFSQVTISKRKISNKLLTPYRDEKGKFTNDKSKREIYHEEFIIIGRKDNV